MEGLVCIRVFIMSARHVDTGYPLLKPDTEAPGGYCQDIIDIENEENRTKNRVSIKGKSKDEIKT